MLRPCKIWGQSYTQVLEASNSLNSFMKFWDGYSGGSMQLAIAADKNRLGLLYVNCKLTSIQPQSYSRQIVIKSILKIFYVRGVAVQNSIVSIKGYASVIDSSRQVIYVKKEK